MADCGRYDVIDLSDSAFNAAVLPALAVIPGVHNTTGASTPPANAQIAQCGEQKTWLVGVNWYLNDYVKLMFNYTQSELSGYPVTTIGAAGTAQFPAGTQGLGLRRRHDQRLRHARSRRLVSEPNQSPVRLRPPPLKRGGGFFLPGTTSRIPTPELLNKPSDRGPIATVPRKNPTVV